LAVEPGYFPNVGENSDGTPSIAPLLPCDEQKLTVVHSEFALDVERGIVATVVLDFVEGPAEQLAADGALPGQDFRLIEMARN
jgi:hypothetical protein